MTIITIIECVDKAHSCDSECHLAHVATTPEKAVEWIKAHRDYGGQKDDWWWSVYEEEVDSEDILSSMNIRFYDRNGNLASQGDLMDRVSS